MRRTSLALAAAVCLTLLSAAAARRSYARYQRGDQGPDMSERGGGGGRDGAALPPPAVGGPNVCRSSSTSSSICCPGWAQRGLTGLCLVPICSRGCGDNDQDGDGQEEEEGGIASRCIKPNLCLCRGGRIQPTCHSGSSKAIIGYIGYIFANLPNM